MKTKLTLTLACTSLVLFGVGCDSSSGNGSATTSPINSSYSLIINENGMTMLPATPAQCPNGGMVLEIFQDLSQTGVYQPNDPIISSTPICNGQNGTSVVFTTAAASAQECPTGGNVLLMASDTLGTGVWDPTDANQQSMMICNGVQGQAGPPSPFSPIYPITPCGANSSPWKEVLLCLEDGSILADFSEDMQGEETRLAFIPPGSYEDTDNSGCYFNVASDGNGGNTVSWGAGSNQYATWNAGGYDCQAQPNAD